MTTNKAKRDSITMKADGQTVCVFARTAAATQDAADAACAALEARGLPAYVAYLPEAQGNGKFMAMVQVEPSVGAAIGQLFVEVQVRKYVKAAA